MESVESNTDDKAQEAADTLKLLYNVAAEFGSTLELPSVLGKVLSLTVKSLDAARGSLFLLDREGRAVKHILVRQHLPPEVREQVIAVVMDVGLAGWVYRHGQSAIIDDTATDARWHVFQDDKRAVRSVMSAPLVRRDEINGIITLEHPEPKAFTQSDLQLLTAIARQAAVAIENARLFTQVREERDVVTAILDSVRDAILVVDGDMNLLRAANPAAAMILGVEMEKAIGKPLVELASREITALFDTEPEDQIRQAEIELDGPRYFHVIVQESPRVGKIAVLHDVTHFKELDALKSELVSTVLHELQNPLGAVLGYAWMLNDGTDLDDEQQLYVTSILESVERMQLLVNNQLDLARIEAGIDVEREVCFVPALVAEVVDQFAAEAAAKEIQLEVLVPNDLPPLSVNRLRITQAVGNLVSNAIKYTPAGGLVTIEAKQSQESIILAVQDNGVGISSVDQTKLFRRFSRVGAPELRKIAGTGLGLAIVRSVAESYGGGVWVESTPGVGSTFYLQIPLDE